MRARFLLLFAPFIASAQIDFIPLGESDYFACSDTYSVFDTSVLGKVARGLGMKRIQKHWGGRGIGYKNESLGWLLAYAEYKVPRLEIDTRLSALSYKCIFEDSIILCRFKMEIPRQTAECANVFQFLLSAYGQELSPGIARNEKFFAALPEKTASTLTLKTWIFPVLGMKYLHGGDPFSSMSRPKVISCYLLDAAGWSCLVFGPLLPFTNRTKLFCASAGLVILTGSRITYTFEARRGLQRYNIILNSRYRIPAGVSRFPVNL